MKKDKPSKKKVNPESDVFLYLARGLAYAIGNVKTYYLIEIDISRRDEFIKQIADSTPEGILKILKTTESFIRQLFPNGITVNVPQDNPRHPNVDLYHILKDALSDAKSVYFHPEMREAFPSDFLALCYVLIWSQALLRLFLYLESNPTARDSLYVYCAKILEADPKAKPYFKKALENLSKLARNRYKKVTGKEPYPVGKKKVQDEPIDTTTQEQKLYSLVWEKVIDVFTANRKEPLSLEESLIKGAKGKVRNVPEAVKNQLIDEYRKYEKRKRDLTTSQEGEEVIKSIESIADIPQLYESENSLKIKKWIEAIKDPKDRKIAQLRFLKGLNVREIEKNLSIPKSTIHDRLKKLKSPV